jgi:small subunit ribosomal protein S9
MMMENAAVKEAPEVSNADPDEGQTPIAEDASHGLTLGTGMPADGSEEPQAEPNVRGKIDRFGVAMGTGRRKTSVARVRIKKGKGAMSINGRTLEDYCRVERDRLFVEAPLRATDMYGKVDIWVRVDGGGPTGQAGAMVLGIARALQAMEPNLHSKLSDGGFLTRDGRMVERKKYGFKKARKSFQFSKR